MFCNLCAQYHDLKYVCRPQKMQAERMADYVTVAASRGQSVSSADKSRKSSLKSRKSTKSTPSTASGDSTPRSQSSMWLLQMGGMPVGTRL